MADHAHFATRARRRAGSSSISPSASRSAFALSKRLLDILLQGAQDQRVELQRDPPVRRAHAQALGLFAQLLAHHDDARGPLEDRRPGDELVEHAAERVDIAAPVDRLARDLLRGHVLGRPEDGEALLPLLLALGHVVGERHRDAEVEQLEASAFGQEEVRGLEIAVYEPSAVRGLERLARLDANLYRLPVVHPARAADALVERLSTSSSIAR